MMPLNNKEISTIIEAHGLYNGNAIKAAIHLSYAVSTIIKYWRANNLPIGERRLRVDGKYTHALTDEEISTIIEAYESYNGNAAEAVRHLPYSKSVIIKYWRANNLPIGKHGGRRWCLESKVFT